MKLLFLLVLLQLHLGVICSPELDLLQHHFLLNLWEDNREVSDWQLNQEIQQSIDNQVSGFVGIVNKAVENSRKFGEIKKPRVQRNLNDLLVNERRKYHNSWRLLQKFICYIKNISYIFNNFLKYLFNFP